MSSTRGSSTSLTPVANPSANPWISLPYKARSWPCLRTSFNIPSVKSVIFPMVTSGPWVVPCCLKFIPPHRSQRNPATSKASSHSTLLLNTPVASHLIQRKKTLYVMYWFQSHSLLNILGAFQTHFCPRAFALALSLPWGIFPQISVWPTHHLC
jgi:hypothetical protein